MAANRKFYFFLVDNYFTTLQNYRSSSRAVFFKIFQTVLVALNIPKSGILINPEPEIMRSTILYYFHTLGICTSTFRCQSSITS